MGEYLSPGVYIEEFEMGAKPIEGVSTSTVGFVGVALEFPKKKVLENLETFVSEGVLTKLKAVTAKLNESTVSELENLVELLEIDIKKLSDEKAKEGALDVLLQVKSVVEDAERYMVSLAFRDKPIFISSWGDYVSKFGCYTAGNYLAPSVYSFFANGGKRCYVVTTKDNKNTSLIGTTLDGVRTGLTAFEEIDEISIVCIPGIVSATGDNPSPLLQTIQDKMISHCIKMGDRFAIFDSQKGATLDEIQKQKNTLVSDKGIGALYYPWIKTAVETKNAKGKIVLKNMLIPPSGAVAGVYARSDVERGVHKAPANEVLRGVMELERSITKAEQDILNPLNVNCIRAFQGRGIRVWGARTIAPKGSEWKYINVRRLFLFLEESIDESTQWVVFEPNNEQLWARVVQTISNFLLGVWKSGALMGKSPEEAFFVKCDRSTMSQTDIANGKLIVVVGLAPTKPAEFVIFRVAQWTASENS